MTDSTNVNELCLSDDVGPDTPLWQFALRVYAAGGVAEKCLFLQDQHGADVNLLLLCCWAGLHGAYLPGEQVEALNQLVAAWRTDIIVPLRRMRRQMKNAVGPIQPSQSAAVRQAIKSVELSAEKTELDFLFNALETLPARNALEAQRGGVVRGNLLQYLSILDVDTADAEVRDGIETLVAGTMALEQL